MAPLEDTASGIENVSREFHVHVHGVRIQYCMFPKISVASECNRAHGCAVTCVCCGAAASGSEVSRAIRAADGDARANNHTGRAPDCVRCALCGGRFRLSLFRVSLNIVLLHALPTG